jgi:predicted MFS family arabinose efflux permease
MVSALVAYLLCFFFIRTPALAVVFTFINWVPYTFGVITIMKWLADVYPPVRYGQFNSAGVLVMSIGGIFLGAFCGYLLDLLKDYRYVYLWNAVFRGVSLAAVLLMDKYRPVATAMPAYSIPQPAAIAD